MTVTKAEGPGMPGATVAPVEPRDTAAARAIESRGGWDLVKMSDADFETRLGYIKTRQERMAKIIGAVLTEGPHYGNPQVRIKGELQWLADGVPKLAFDKPILKQAGASELRNFFRYDCRPYAEPVIVQSATEVMVTVIVGLYDAYHNLLGTAVGACHSKEKRFAYLKDPRDQLNNIYKQAFKRAAVQVTAQCTGADAFFGLEDSGSKDPYPDPVKRAERGAVLSREQARVVREASVSRGIKTRGELRAVIEAAFGEGVEIGQANFEDALDVIARYVPGAVPMRPNTAEGTKVTPVRSARDPYIAGDPLPEERPATPSGALDLDEEPGDAAEDDEDDLPL